ncbi:MAG: tyrosine-protein phosphatase, partial [Ruminococcus sp.]|nr:tyrosine-protein phosphatase [Ruminococcus sp.]
MSIASEISRINQNIAAAYTACQNKGATMPQTQNSANMAAAIASISTGVPGQDLTWDQRQTDVKNYLNTVTYSPSDYTTSSIASYVTTTGHHKPVGVSITVPEAGTLTVTDGMGIMTVAVTAGTYTVYNITPGATGMYILRDTNDEIVAAGTLKPTGALRMIRLQDSTSGNVRDLGGWSCDGGTVAYGKLFRGSRLFADGSVNDYDKMLMHDFLGIQHELELRYSSEIASEPQYSLIGRDVEWTHIDGAWYSIADSAKCRAMLDCVMDSAIKGIPLYFHCAGGADRTGTLAMMIEAILGVSQSDIDKDYELTCYYSGVATDAQARRRNESEWT